MLSITDPETGVNIDYYGQRSPTPELANELIGSAIVDAGQKLLDGSYKTDGFGTDLDSTEAARNLEKLTALQLRVPVENVDSGGLGSVTRFKLGMRPTKGQKLEYLRSIYGYDNVKAVPVNGKYRMLVQNGDKYTFVNEEGLDFGDVAEFGGGAAIPILVAGAVTTRAPQLAAPLATAGWGSSAGLAAISGASYFTAGSLQDAVVSAIDQQNIDFAEIAKRRGKESAIALVPEALAIRGAQWLTGFAGGGSDKIARQLRSDIAELNSVFQGKLRAASGGLASRTGAAVDQRAAANSGAIRKLFQDNINQLESMTNSLARGSGESIENVVERARNSLTERLTKLQDDVGVFDKELADSVGKILQTRLKKLGGTERLYLRRPLGKQVQTGLQKAFEVARNQKRKLFDDVTRVADEEAIVYDVDAVLRAMRRAIEKGGGEFDDIDVARAFASSMEKTGITDEVVLKALKDRLPMEFTGGMADFKPIKAMSYRQLDNLIKRYAERADFGDPLKPTKNSAAFARIMRKELTKVRDKDLKGTKTQKALDKANSFYRGEYGKFIRGDVKPMIKPDFGSGYGGLPGETYLVKGGEAAMKYALASSDNMRGIINALPRVAPEGQLTQSQAVDLLRKAYIAEIGLNGTVQMGKGFGIKGINNDIMSVLYPRNWESKVKAFERLDELAKKGGKVIEVDDLAFREILSAGTPTQVKNAERIAQARINTATKVAEIEQNKLMKSLLNRTGALSTEDAIQAVGSLLNYSSDDIAKFVKLVKETSGEAGLKSLQSKLADDILKSARPEKANYPMSTQGRPLFDSDILLTRLKNNETRKVVKEVLGEEWLENMEAIARVARYSTGETKRFPGVRPVVSPGSGGFHTTFVATDLPADVARYFYGKFATTPGLKRLLSRKTPDEAAAAFRQILPYYMFSAEGLKTLIQDARDNPALEAYIQGEVGNLGSTTQGMIGEATAPRNPSMPQSQSSDLPVQAMQSQP